MNKYESIIILNSSITDEVKEAFVEKMKGLISEHGEVAEVNEWGRKTLAYEIKKQKEGYYILFDFTAKPEFIAEFERVLKLDDSVLKEIVIKK